MRWIVLAGAVVFCAGMFTIVSYDVGRQVAHIESLCAQHQMVRVEGGRGRDFCVDDAGRMFFFR